MTLTESHFPITATPSRFALRLIRSLLPVARCDVFDCSAEGAAVLPLAIEVSGSRVVRCSHRATQRVKDEASLIFLISWGQWAPAEQLEGLFGCGRFAVP